MRRLLPDSSLAGAAFSGLLLALASAPWFTDNTIELPGLLLLAAGLGLMLLGGVVYACFGRDTNSPGEQGAEDAAHNTGDEA